MRHEGALHYLVMPSWNTSLSKTKPPLEIPIATQANLSRESQDEDVGSIRTVEGIRVGRMFASCHQERKPGLQTQLVYVFHLSYAVNYNHHESCFRQFLHWRGLNRVDFMLANGVRKLDRRHEGAMRVER